VTPSSNVSGLLNHVPARSLGREDKVSSSGISPNCAAIRRIDGDRQAPALQPHRRVRGEIIVTLATSRPASGHVQTPVRSRASDLPSTPCEDFRQVAQVDTPTEQPKGRTQTAVRSSCSRPRPDRRRMERGIRDGHRPVRQLRARHPRCSQHRHPIAKARFAGPNAVRGIEPDSSQRLARARACIEREPLESGRTNPATKASRSGPAPRAIANPGSTS